MASVAQQTLCWMSKFNIFIFNLKKKAQSFDINLPELYDLFLCCRNFQVFNQQLWELWQQEPFLKSVPGPAGDMAKVNMQNLTLLVICVYMCVFMFLHFMYIFLPLRSSIPSCLNSHVSSEDPERIVLR